MTNITLAIDGKLLKEARDFAKRNGTTLNGLVRQRLTELIAEESRMEESRLKLLELMETSTGRLPKGWKFDREKLYESPALSRHKRTRLRSNSEGI